MKNKYLKKLLCITMIAVMVMSSSPMTALAALEEDTWEQGKGPTKEEGSLMPEATGTPTVTVTPSIPEETPAPTPGEGETGTPTPTPGEGETETPTPTPTPGGGTETPTPTPGEGETETPTPTPPPTEESPAKEKIAWIIAQLEGLGEITLESEPLLLEIRSLYDSLSSDDKFLVTNYEILLHAEENLALLKTGTEEALQEVQEEPEEPEAPGFSNENNGAATNTAPGALQGEPVYVTGAVSNLHAGKDFYLDSLKEEYQLEFSEDFPTVMEEIEEEYKTANKLVDTSDLTGDTVTSSRDMLLVRNWQDILAVYIYEQEQKGEKAEAYVLDRNAKEELAEIFARMNPVVRDKQDITKVGYGNRHINYYIKEEKIAKKDRALLKKYVETDCKLLCATVTGAKGFVRQSVGEDVSEERVNVIAAAYSLVGKIGYFWGGKSSALGWDDSWGSAVKVDAAGSRTTGSLRAYGLDCSGFVTWAFNNGYWDTSLAGQIGDGTTDQWNRALTVSETDAQPGDLVFQRGPEAGSDNHVGIICGQTDSGDWIAVHCSSSQNGVTVGEAYSASFRYIRRPACYPTKEELAGMQREEDSEGTKAASNSWEALLLREKL